MKARCIMMIVSVFLIIGVFITSQARGSAENGFPPMLDDTSSDALLAQALSQSFGAEDFDVERFRRETEGDRSNDALLAQLISEESVEGMSVEGMDAPLIIIMPKVIRDTYAAYDDVMKTRVTYDMGVHLFNTTTGLKTHLPILMKEDTFSVPMISFAETRKSLEESEDHQSFEKKAVLKANLDRLHAHLTTSKIEASETGTNVEELFSRVWSLAEHNPEFVQQLFVSLCDNSETGGGCYAGHAGRLARLYINFLRPQWFE